ncbi:ABC transporter permease [Marinivivus vitaminiproducens]|uniref:ABC transporter permease n=1 Tax=Marinivivus vitaminiproducens TaxID=3035935 RepID=UPI0027A15EDF|nr:ABC transporter permease [Geminicoccaceae bacterium SCSIO 64248]
MLRYVLGRLAQSLVALLLLLLIIFAMTRLTGDPTDLYLPLSASEAERAAFAEAQGFNDPLIVQFGRYVGEIAQGSFGESLFKARPALDVALEAFPVTLKLAAFTMAIAMACAVVLGSLAAYWPNSLFDRVVSVLTIVIASTPTFWVAIVAIVIFSISFQWLPTSGTGSAVHWILPVGVLVLTPLGLLTQVVRASMVGCLRSAYVKTAMAKGAASRRIIFVHALRNAVLPLITVAGVQATGLINGAVVIETIFGFPGIGKLMIDSIRNRDFALTVACITLAAVVVYLMNMLIDIVYSRLDPRVRIK